jgi:hypothetical protein
MGFKIDWDKNRVWSDLSRMMAEVSSPHNDGFTASYIKKDLYDIKCFIDERYDKLPKFVGEEEWEKQRVLRILKKPNQP